MAGTYQSPRSVKINALQDECLQHGTALLREFAIETLPGDIVHGLVSAVTRWGVSAVEQLPIAVLAVDLPGDFFTCQDVVHAMPQLGCLLVGALDGCAIGQGRQHRYAGRGREGIGVKRAGMVNLRTLSHLSGCRRRQIVKNLGAASDSTAWQTASENFGECGEVRCDPVEFLSPAWRNAKTCHYLVKDEHNPSPGGFFA